jgi:hypothetical protein
MSAEFCVWRTMKNHGVRLVDLQMLLFYPGTDGRGELPIRVFSTEVGMDASCGKLHFPQLAGRVNRRRFPLSQD